MAENDIVYGDQLSFLNDLRHKMSLSTEEEAKLIKSLKFVHFKKGEIVEGQNELLKNIISLLLNWILFSCHLMAKEIPGTYI